MADLPNHIRMVAENVSDAILTIDVHSRICYANPASAELFGRPVDTLIGSSLTSLMPERFRADHERGLARYLRTGKRNLSWSGVRLPGLDAEDREISIEISFGEFEVDDERFFTGVVRDVSRQERIMREIEESRLGYQALVESLPLGIVVHRGEQILYANPEAARIVGLDDPKGLEGEWLLGFAEPELVEEIRERLRRVETNREPADVLSRLVRRVDGQYVDVEAWAIPISYKGLPAVQTLVRDLTEWKLAEESLEASERRYRLLFESSRDPIYLTSADGTVLDVNPAFCALFGFTRDELLEMNALELYVDPADRERFLREMAVDGSVQDFEVRLKRADETPLDCLLTSSARTTVEGEIAGYQGIIRDVTERKRLLEELAHRALHDWLTNLPNRALLHDRLAHALAGAHRKAGHVGILFIDLDRFKLVNDSLGHTAGDRILLEVGRRLSSCLREEDTVARVGGDEFIVLLERLASPDAACQAAERIREAFSRPFRLDDTEVQLSASIGVSTHGLGGHPGDAPSPDELVRQADRAMYSAKALRATAYCVFDPREHAGMTPLLQLESELRTAIREEELELHYQPIVALDTGRVCAVEPLVRWRHPQRGLIGPTEFIPVAEESGLIASLERWVLIEAAREVAKWEHLHPDAATLDVHPNLSAVRFEDPDLGSEIEAVLAEVELAPHRLQFEVTESAVIRRPESALALRGLGVRVAVDDFGTGYSSMATLRDLEVDMLKIDLLFVRRIAESPRDEAIVEAIVALSRSLGLDLVAEGIEERCQLDVLRRLGCEKGQGFYFARPIPAQEFVEIWKMGNFRFGGESASVVDA